MQEYYNTERRKGKHLTYAEPRQTHECVSQATPYMEF